MVKWIKANSAEALEILQLFSGNTHMIYTCLHIILKNESEEFFENKIIQTEVEFDQIPMESMINYSKSEHFVYFLLLNWDFKEYLGIKQEVMLFKELESHL